MPDLDVQIREYFEATSTPLLVDDVLEVPVGGALVRPMTPRRAPRPLYRGWLVGVAAAVLALVVFGAVSVLSGGTEGGPVGTTPDTSTSTTIQVESAPTTIVTLGEPATIVPGLGTLRWMRITGDKDSLPTAFESDPNGGFISYENAKVWRSEDAVTWRSEPGAPEFAQFEHVSVQDGWAIGHSDDSSEFFRRVGDSWVLVELESPRLPNIVGVDWFQLMAFPVESDGTAFVGGTARAEIPWGDIYGTFEVDDGGQSPPWSQAPMVRWDDQAGTLRIMNPANASILAELSVTVFGDTVSFNDVDTGETVHTVIGTPDYPAERIAEQMTTGGPGLVQAFGWVSHQGGAFVPVVVPWTDAAIYAVPDGGFAAYEFVTLLADRLRQPQSQVVSADMWTSTDGVEWTSRGEPQFFNPAVAQQIVVQRGLRDLWASVVTGYTVAGVAGAEVSEDWVSTDGVTWDPVSTPFPLIYSREYATDFGSVVAAMPQSFHMWWVSTDGSVWHRVAGPPGGNLPEGASNFASGAARDVLYDSIGDLSQDAETRTLWIGRFEPSP